MSITDTVVDEKAGRAYFTLRWTGQARRRVSLTYRTAQGTALAGVDYQGLTARTLTFAPGERAKTVAVNVIDDDLREGEEYFDLLLLGASGASMPDTRGRAIIGPSDQTTATTPVVTVSDIVANESDGYAEFVFRLDAPSNAPVTVHFDSVDGSAKSSKYSNEPDFATVPFSPGNYQTLTFAPGVTVRLYGLHCSTMQGLRRRRAFSCDCSILKEVRLGPRSQRRPYHKAISRLATPTR